MCSSVRPPAAAPAGYLQYEVSNFSLPGRRALHNSGYWDRSPYIGLGPGAHSFDGDRRRWWNAPDLDRYIAAFGGGSTSGGFSASGGVSASGDALASDVAPASTPAFGEDLPASSCGSASSAVPITGDFSTSAYRDCAVSSVVSEEILTDEDVLTETIMLGLRTVDGLPLDVLVAMCRPSSSSVPDSRSGFAQPSSSTVPDSRSGSVQPLSSTVPDSRSGAAENTCHSLLSQLPRPLRTSVDRLLATGFLILRNGRLSIPSSRLFISDSIIRELL